MVLSPMSSIIRRTSRGAPLNDSRSFSNSSTFLNPAAAIASSFSLKPPLRQTVAIEFSTSSSETAGKRDREEQHGELHDHEARCCRVRNLSRELCASV